MKNLSLILNGVLFVAVAILFYLHFSAKSTDAATTMASDTTIVNAKGKAVVYLDTDSLLKNYEFSKTIQADIEAKRTTAEATVKSKQTTFETKVREYQNKMEYLTPSERAKTEDNLNKMKMDAEQTAYDMQNKLAAETAGLQEQLFTRVEAFLKDYSKVNGHTYVLQYQRGMSSILYGDPSLNITVDVVNKLNAQYKKEQEAATPAK